MSVQTTYSDAPVRGFEGMVDGGPHDIMPMINAAASASIGFGRAVIFKSGGNAQDADLPSSETDKVAGIVVFSQAYSRAYTDSNGTFGDLDSTGLRPGVMMNVLRKGRILVVCEDGCTKGDRLWVRAVAGAAPEYLGGLNNADDGTDMIDCTGQGQWLETKAAGELCWLEVDFMAEA